MKRKVGYSWHLREVMARNRVYTATELVPMLHDRGVDLSASQVHRLVSGTPERLSLQVLSALCDILECTPADLVTTTAENAGVRKTATGDLPAPSAAVAKLRAPPGTDPGRRMSRPYATDEQYERWYLADCCRCGRRRNKAGAWPDGHVCRTCGDRALRRRGTCPGCGQERVLPGRRPGDGAAICPGCAGFSQSFACTRCGFEGKLHGDRLCTRCAFADRLAGLLDDGTGRIRPELAPLADALLAMDNPLSGLTWLYPRQGRSGSADDLLRRLGRGEIQLTHEAFNDLQPWRAASHLRDLLMACGVLPAVDKQLCAFERWLGIHLATVADSGHAQVLRCFATWEVLPRLRARAEKKPLSTGARGYAVGQVLRATEFLQWLSERGLALSGCRQADIDAWHAGSSENHRNAVRTSSSGAWPTS